MPTASSPSPVVASTHPRPPQYGPRGTGSSAEIACSAVDFGAPDTEPGGPAASISSRQPTPVAQPARHGRDEVHQSRVLLLLEQRVDPHRARTAHVRQVVAHQVGDHHVLGDVLVEHLRRAVAAVPLIGALVTRSPARRRNSSGEAETTQPVAGVEHARVGRRVAAGEDGRERPRVGVRAERRGQHPAQVDLVDLALAHELAHRAARRRGRRAPSSEVAHGPVGPAQGARRFRQRTRRGGGEPVGVPGALERDDDHPGAGSRGGRARTGRRRGRRPRPGR